MMMLPLLMRCVLLNLFLLSDGYEVNIKEWNGLQKLLCNNSCSLDLSNVAINITVDQQIEDAECSVKDVSNVTITGWNKVYCSGEVIFLFANVSYLELSHLEFINCAGALGTDGANSATLYFTPDQKAGLVLNNCMSPTVTDLYILNSIGYGILLLNSYGEVLISYLSVKHTNGSGALLYFSETEHMKGANVSIVHSVFSENFMPDSDFVLENPIKVLKSNRSAPSAGGLTLLLSSLTNAHVSVTLHDVEIHKNRGVYGGGCLVLLNEVFNHSAILFSNCSFAGNQIQKNSRIGASLVIYEYDLEERTCSSLNEVSIQNLKDSWVVASVIDSSFKGKHHNNKSSQYRSAAEFGTAIYSSLTSHYCSVALKIKGVDFEDNYVHTEGACVYAKCRSMNVFSRSRCQFFLTDITSRNNGDLKARILPSSGAAGLFTFVDVMLVHFQGAEKEARLTNGIGSVIKLHRTNLVFSGNLYFGDNEGTFGSVVNAECSFLFLEDSLRAVFENNRASIGGGVFFSKGDNVLNPDRYCFFQYSGTILSNSMSNISLNFINNTAEEYGNSIYVAPLYNCTITNANPDSLQEVYKELFLFNDSVHDYSDSVWSIPETIQVCNGSYRRKSIYPGEMITVSLSALDAVGNIVHAQVQFELSKSSERKLKLPKYAFFDGTHGETLKGHECTDLNLTINSKDENNEEKTVYLHAQVVGTTVRKIVSMIEFKDCPLGFSQISGACECHELIEKDVKRCELIDGSAQIELLKMMWIGCKTNNHSILAKSNVCPKEFCTLGNTVIADKTNIDICQKNRGGYLCGNCTDNTNVVFGSDKCMKCGDYWKALWPCIVPLFGGVVLVAILFLLNMTISKGDINGFIFYVNAAIVSNLYFINTHDDFGNVLARFMQLLNFNLFSPLVCCIESMTMTLKTGLQFLFPAYLWLLVLFVILLSYLSRRVADRINNCSIQVFATIVYLSYSKLLSTSIYSLVPAKVESSDNQTETVWFYDGQQTYFSTGQHLALGIVSALILILVILPYTLLLTIGSWMMRCHCIYLNHFVDAHHGPYKDKWRWWFGLRLWVLLYMFAVYTAFLTDHEKGFELVLLLQVIVLVPFIAAQAYVQPFRSTCINILDLHFMMNNCLNSIIALYFKLVDDDDCKLTIVTCALIVESLVVFLAIVLFHAYKAMKNIRCFQRCLNYVRCRVNYDPIMQFEISPPGHKPPSTTDLQVKSNSNDHYRESLFQHEDNQ